MRKTTLLLTTLLLIIIFVPALALAYEVRTDASTYVGKDEVIDGNLYAAGNSITVDGEVKGDVFCAGQSININGTVAGDVFCAGQSININGDIGGSVRVAGNSINISKRVAHNVQALGASLGISSDAEIGWDVFFAGATGEIRGKIGGSLHGGAANMVIAGDIAKDVRLRLDDNVKKDIGYKSQVPILVTEDASIGGNLYYTAGREGEIKDGAKIAGEIGFSPPAEKQAPKLFSLLWFWKSIFSIFGALVVGLVLVSLWREPIKKLTDNMLLRVGPAIGWGVVMMFLTPIIILLLLVTLIGIPLAVIAAALWLISLYIAKILTAILFGRSLLRKVREQKEGSLIAAMIIGVVLTWIICSLPILGWIFGLVALWWGLGGIWLYFKKS